MPLVYVVYFSYHIDEHAYICFAKILDFILHEHAQNFNFCTMLYKLRVFYCKI